MCRVIMVRRVREVHQVLMDATGLRYELMTVVMYFS